MSLRYISIILFVFHSELVGQGIDLAKIEVDAGKYDRENLKVGVTLVALKEEWNVRVWNVANNA